MSALPRMLHQPDYAKRAESEIALQNEMLSDEIALRLGRAFLKGRLDQFLNLTIHVEPGAAPPYPTQEENDLYAGGFQYNFDSNMHDELAEEEDPEQLKRVAHIMDRLAQITVEVENGGLTLELLSERSELRFELTTATLGNLMKKLGGDPLEVVMRKALAVFAERRPYATGKSDVDAANES